MSKSERAARDILALARDSYRRRAWAEAYSALTHADAVAPLDSDDLERLATAAYLTGRDRECLRILERRHRLELERGEPARAVRSAFWLALLGLLRGDAGFASGWLARGRDLLGARDCVEQGYLLLPMAEQHLAEGDVATASEAAGRATVIGQRFGDRDLIACARHVQGRVCLRQERIKQGLALLDEAMVAVLAGELSPIATGLIYCSVIEACQEVHAVSRAREWTLALAHWCDAQPDLVAFTATCRVRRAEVLQFGGAWIEAMTEARLACERAEQAGRTPPGAAFYQLAEILRLRGELHAADEAYARACQLGCDPQPGLALLRKAEGRLDAAAAAIRRVAAATTDRLRRGRLLPAYIEILLATGELDDARRASLELDGLAADLGTSVLPATSAQWRGAVTLAEGKARDALEPLRRALEMWLQVEAPYFAARTRVLIALSCRALGDEESARLELAAARALFHELGAAPDLAQADAIAREEPALRPLLTARERQVLQLVAAGKTNKAIAGELSVSERTVDRHMSNILTKLDVSSRAAAIAYAYTHKLL